MAASEIKAVELDFSPRRTAHFYERYNPFNNMDALSESDVIQTESPDNL